MPQTQQGCNTAAPCGVNTTRIDGHGVGMSCLNIPSPLFSENWALQPQLSRTNNIESIWGQKPSYPFLLGNRIRSCSCRAGTKVHAKSSTTSCHPPASIECSNAKALTTKECIKFHFRVILSSSPLSSASSSLPSEVHESHSGFAAAKQSVQFFAQDSVMCRILLHNVSLSEAIEHTMPEI